MSKIDQDFHLMNDHYDRRNEPTPWDSYAVIFSFIIVVVLIRIGIF